MLQTVTPYLIRVCRSVDALRRLVILLVLAAFVPPLRAGESDAAAAKRTYDIAAGDAATTLRRFVEQSGEQVIYIIPRVRGVTTNPVKGEFTARETLDRMVARTDLVVVKDEKTGALMISRAAPTPPTPDRPSQPKSNTQTPEEPPKTMKPENIFSLWMLSVISALGQAIPPPETLQEPPQPDPIVLTPFLVTSSTDRGYVATNTEAGSRLNSRILDTPSAISVMTAEFLQDIGAINIDEALEYGLNTEVFSENDDGGYRIRGIRSGSFGRNFFIRGTGDTYNIDRVTFSRGPNSILFGNADPAGIININTKQANLTKNQAEVSNRVDSNDGWRFTGDYNRVLVPRRAALRLDGLYQNLNGYRKPAFDDWKAWYAAGTVVLVDKESYQMTARFDFEQVDRKRNRARVDVITDAVSYWHSTGGVTVPNANGVTGPATTPPGATRQGATNYLVVVDQSLTPIPVLNWRNTGRGAVDPGGVLPASGDIWPLYINSQGLTASLEDDRQRFRTIYLEQKLGQNLYLQLAYNDYNQRFYRSWSNTGFTELRVDINARLPSLAGGINPAGLPNPNVGQYYFEKNMRPQDYTHEESTFRASLAYELDPREKNPWLGFHRIAGSYDRRSAGRYIDNLREVNLTPLPGYPTTLANSQNYIFRRSYVYKDEGIYVVGNVLNPITQGPGGINSGYARIDTPTAVKTEADSLFGALQSFWLKNRWVTTIGVRRDNVKNYDRNLSIGPDQQGIWPLAGAALLNPEPADSAAVTTKSLGTVFHVTKKFSLFYNQSDNFSPGTSRHDINGDVIPISVGKGRDFGVKLQLLDQRLSGTLGIYENTKDWEIVTNLQGVGPAHSAIDSIWTILEEPSNSLRRRGGGFSDYRSTRDYEAKGYELELTYNPTGNWRTSLTVAKNETTFQKVAPALDKYIERFIDEWRANGQLSSGGDNINEILDNRLLPAQRELKSMEGDTAAFIRPWNATFVTSYRFRNSTPLQGFSLGGSVRFRDRPIIGFGDKPDGTIDRSTIYYGREIFETDAFIRYERRLFNRKVRWSCRLGVRNLLDETDPLEVRARVDGLPDRLQLVQPRTFTLTNTFAF